MSTVIEDPEAERAFTYQLTQEEIDHVVELLIERQEWEPESDTVYTRILAKFEALGAFKPDEYYVDEEGAGVSWPCLEALLPIIYFNEVNESAHCVVARYYGMSVKLVTVVASTHFFGRCLRSPYGDFKGLLACRLGPSRRTR